VNVYVDVYVDAYVNVCVYDDVAVYGYANVDEVFRVCGYECELGCVC